MSSYPLVRRLPLRALVVSVTAALLLTTALTDVASAHGSTIDPMSRNYSCWKRWGSNFQAPEMATQDPMCWQAWQADPNAMWNWNGLYRDGVGGNHQAAVPDGQLCSGGNTSDGRYAALDVPGPWQATRINNNFTVTVHDQAKHGADYYRVYVTRQGFNPLTQRPRWADLELVTQTGVIPPGQGTPSSDPVLNGVSVNIAASAPGRTGRHIVYTIWKASHADQNYYFCSDVIFPGGPSEPPPTTAPPTTRPPTTAPPTTRPPTSTPPTTRPPTTAPPATPGAPGSCSARYVVTGQWPGGFQADITVTAGGTAIRGWRVNWTFANGQQVASAWNATVTSSGAAVTATNVNYNGALGAGASTGFGFTGSWNASNAVPALTCTAT